MQIMNLDNNVDQNVFEGSDLQKCTGKVTLRSYLFSTLLYTIYNRFLFTQLNNK